MQTPLTQSPSSLSQTLQRILAWVRGSHAGDTGSVLSPSHGMQVLADADDPLANVPRYPPFDRGLPVLAPDKIVASQQELIDRLFRSAGLSKDLFAQHCAQPVELLAKHVHLLPATATAHHRGAGGLFRMSLEVALHTLQSANASVFPIAGGGARRFELQPRWVIACMLSGLCSQLFRTVSMLAVFDRTNSAWQPLLQGLYPWTLSRNVDAYFVRWPDATPFQQGAVGASAYLINHVVPPTTLQWLAEGNNTIIPALTGAINGARVGSTDNPITRLLSPVITRVIEDDLRRNALNFEHLQIGVQLEPHLVDSMRRLWRSGDWFANAPGAVVLVGTDGVYLDWARASDQVVMRLIKDAFAGVPRDPDTLADMLTRAGVFVRPGPDERYVTLVMPDTGEVLQGCVCFAAPDLIFPDGFDYRPLAKGALAMKPEPPAPEPKAPPRAKPPRQRTPAAAPDAGVAAVSQAHPAQSSPSREDRDMEQGVPLPDEGPSQAAKRLAPTTTPSSMETGPQDASSAANDLPQEAPQPQEPGREGRTEQGDRMLTTLSKSSAWLLREIARAVEEQRLTGFVRITSNAVAISHEELTAHGQDASALLDELLIKSWLWIDKSKPTRKIHPIEIDGETHRAMMLKPEIARAIGLVSVEASDAPA